MNKWESWAVATVIFEMLYAIVTATHEPLWLNLIFMIGVPVGSFLLTIVIPE